MTTVVKADRLLERNDTTTRFWVIRTNNPRDHCSRICHLGCSKSVITETCSHKRNWRMQVTAARCGMSVFLSGGFRDIVKIGTQSSDDLDDDLVGRIGLTCTMFFFLLKQTTRFFSSDSAYLKVLQSVLWSC